MRLRILLPFRVFLEIDDVISVVLETSAGAYGLLPHRLDCVAALVPGIFTYETASGAVHYLALDEGVLVKSGEQLIVSVRNAFSGADLGDMRAKVEEEFIQLDENERNTRSALAKMESGFIHQLEKFQRE